jgi:hypothetical protein
MTNRVAILLGAAAVVVAAGACEAGLPIDADDAGNCPL